MPRKSQASITIPKKVYDLAKKHCFRNNINSVAGWITNLILREIGERKEQKDNEPDKL